MTNKSSILANWTPEQLANGRIWVQAWRAAAKDMDRVRREELRRPDAGRAVAFLCGPADYRCPPRSPRPTSGLVEQQQWFKRAAGRD